MDSGGLALGTFIATTLGASSDHSPSSAGGDWLREANQDPEINYTHYTIKGAVFPRPVQHSRECKAYSIQNSTSFCLDCA
jgi:hypothetical protein